MKFAKYLAESIIKIAGGIPFDKKLYHDRVDVFFQLIERGMKPATARRVMDLYM